MPKQIDADTAPSLLLRLRDPEDHQSWETFVGVYSPMIYNFCRLRALQASDAADVTQEVLLRVSKAIRRFEYDRQQGYFRDWLARIVINEIRRFTGKQRAVTLGDDYDAEGTADLWNEHFQQHVFSAALERCRPHFSDNSWALFEQSWIERKPVAEVAEALHSTPEKVYVARSRILKRLKSEVVLLAEELPF